MPKKNKRTGDSDIMLATIQKKYESLIEKREDLLQQLGSLSSEVLCFKAGPVKWCIDVHFENHMRQIDRILAQSNIDL